MKKKFNSLFLLLFLLTPFGGHATNNSILSQIDYTDGLSNSSVLSLHQDSKGLMWFGTCDGLNNYDGKSMRVYRTDMTTENKLLNNNIYQINSASTSSLWISTSTGINLFSLNECRVIGSFDLFSDGYSLYSNGSGDTWVMDKEDIYYFDNSSFQFVKVKGNKKHFTPELSFVDEKGYLWLFSSSGNSIYRCSIDDLKTDEDVFSSTRTNIHQKRIIYTYCQDGILSFVDEANDLFLFDIVRNTKIYIRNISDLVEKYGGIKGIVPFDGDIIIAFVENGLIKLDAAARYAETIMDRNLRILSIYKDPNQNILWIGTDGHGVMTYTKKQSIGTQLLFSKMQNKLSRQVRSISTDKEGNLWFGTKGDGLVKVANYRENSQKDFPLSAITVYFPGTKSSLKEYNRGFREYQVFGIAPSKYLNGFWIASDDNPGLSYYSYEKDKIIPLYDDSHILKEVRRIYEENDSTLWLTTLGNGLCRVLLNEKRGEPQIKAIKQYIFEEGGREVNKFFSLIEQGDSLLWLGSRGSGLLKLNLKSDEKETFLLNNTEKLSRNDVLSIYNKEGTFYLGTTSGLVKWEWDESNRPLLSYIDKAQGMLNDVIHGILEDENGHLWLSTNKGLVKYNTANGAFHTYYYNNGLQIGEFSDDAYYKCPYTGSLFFGGIDGLLYLDKNRVGEVDYQPSVIFRDLKIGVDAVNLYDYYSEADQQLTLHGSTVSFSLSFIAPDFIEGNNFEYSYKLEGDKSSDWSPFSSNHIAAFNALKYGSYQLKVRYKKDVFDTESNYYNLNIKVKPSWYLSPKMMAIYLLLLLVGGVYIVLLLRSYIRGRIRKAHREKGNGDSNESGGKAHEAIASFTAIYNMCGKLHQFKSMPKEYYQMLDLIHEKILSFAFKTECGWSEPILLEDYLPEEAPLFSLLQMSSLSTEVFDMLKKGGCSDHSQLTIVMDENLQIPLPKKRMAYLLYYLYQQLIQRAMPVTLFIGEEEGTLLVKATLSAEMITKLVELEREEGDLTTQFEKNLYKWLYRYALQTMKGEILVHETELSIRLPFQKLELAPTDIVKKRVLLLEDKEELFWLVSDLLSADYGVQCVRTMQEAFAYLRKEKVDVFIADTMIYLKEENKFIEYLEVNKGLLVNSLFIPLLTWKSTFLLQKRFGELIDGFVVMPHSILFLKEVVERAMNQRKPLIEPTQLVYSEKKEIIYRTPEQTQFAKQLLKLLDEHLDNEELNSAFIADKMHISPRQYYRKFKEVFDLSPADYIKNYRIERAAKLLIETDWPIQKVIAEVGIQSRSYFYKEFAVRYGVTPKIYKKTVARVEE
ncbi:MAG: two-component regulator propeller domain-containing protein [Phocaeicola sp.]